MSLSRHLLRRIPPLRAAVGHSHFCTSVDAPSPNPPRNDDYRPPSSFINSWEPPANPREAAVRLNFLRRDYKYKVKALRKAYQVEVELKRVEKLRREEEKKEARRIASEEGKAAREEKKKAAAIERQAFEEEFRQTLMKERAQRLKYWRGREKKVEEKKKRKKQLLVKQSSLWVEESKLEDKILEALGDSTSL